MGFLTSPFSREPKKAHTTLTSKKRRVIPHPLEVKTRFGQHRVALTENQHEVAGNLGKEYFLYVVTDNDKICIVRNPVAKCKIVRILRYEYQLEDWKSKGKIARVK